MRVMVFFKSNVAGDPLQDPTPEVLEAFKAMDAFTEELVKAGVFVAAAGLKGGVATKRIAFEGTSRRIIDGPFTETKELVAGFSIWEVKDMDEAVAWANRCPNPNPTLGSSEIEIRPFYEVEDLQEFVTAEDLANPRTGERGKLGVA
ncbi:MAG: YciI family protein [Pseudomonadota bacterium]